MSQVPPPNEAIAELCLSLGDDSARELIEMFLANFPAVVEQLRSNDREQRRRAAHSLKSSSHIVGAIGLSNLMSVLEARLTLPDGKITPADITATIAEFEKMAVALRSFARQSPV